MGRKTLFILWGSMYILCAGLGFIPETGGVLGALRLAAAVAFFVPPCMLLWSRQTRQDAQIAKLVHNLSALSLLLTVLLLVANFLSAFQSEALGSFLYGVLVVVSCPMVCSGHWALSLFLWACILIISRRKLRVETAEGK